MYRKQLSLILSHLGSITQPIAHYQKSLKKCFICPTIAVFPLLLGINYDQMTNWAADLWGGNMDEVWGSS